MSVSAAPCSTALEGVFERAAADEAEAQAVALGHDEATARAARPLADSAQATFAAAWISGRAAAAGAGDDERALARS